MNEMRARYDAEIERRQTVAGLLAEARALYADGFLTDPADGGVCRPVAGTAAAGSRQQRGDGAIDPHRRASRGSREGCACARLLGRCETLPGPRPDGHPGCRRMARPARGLGSECIDRRGAPAVTRALTGAAPPVHRLAAPIASDRSPRQLTLALQTVWYYQYVRNYPSCNARYDHCKGSGHDPQTDTRQGSSSNPAIESTSFSMPETRSGSSP